MVEYGKKTCYNCGRRDIQPNMRRVQITKDVGSSRSTMDGTTILGAILGVKSAGRAFSRSFWHAGSRSYTRKATVWCCKSCAGNSSVFGYIASVIGYVFLFYAIAIVIALGSGVFSQLSIFVENFLK